jgi:hypothetical protein
MPSEKFFKSHEHFTTNFQKVFTSLPLEGRGSISFFGFRQLLKRGEQGIVFPLSCFTKTLTDKQHFPEFRQRPGFVVYEVFQGIYVFTKFIHFRFDFAA